MSYMDPTTDFNIPNTSWSLKTPDSILRVRWALAILGAITLAILGVAIAYAAIGKKYAKKAWRLCEETTCPILAQTKKNDTASMVVLILTSVATAIVFLLLVITGAVSIQRRTA